MRKITILTILVLTCCFNMAIADIRVTTNRATADIGNTFEGFISSFEVDLVQRSIDITIVGAAQSSTYHLTFTGNDRELGSELSNNIGRRIRLRLSGADLLGYTLTR